MSHSKEIKACINALHAMELALDTYASSAPGQKLVDDIAKALEVNGGDLGKDVSVAIRRSMLAPAARQQLQLS